MTSSSISQGYNSVHQLGTRGVRVAAGGNKYPLWATLVAGGFHCLLEGAVSLDSLQLVPLPRPCVHAGRVLGLWTRILA